MIFFLLPEADYDPTESAVPWAALRAAGFEISFATPGGRPAYADDRLVNRGFGPLSPVLMTRQPALQRYREMIADPAFAAPRAYSDVDPAEVTGLVIPGGHAAGVRSLLESPEAQSIVRSAFAADKPVGAICHGMLLPARTIVAETGRSVLYGKRTTALPRWMELSSWNLTRLWLGGYFRTYPKTVQAEVTAVLADPSHFLAGPRLAVRDNPTSLKPGFVVRDGNFLSARWPGDCYRFGAELVALFRQRVPQGS
jgi:putative intracellular protease/amidase